ncbi:MAG: hypothetical protein ACLTMP_09030 [Eggerthella lenta]
MSSFDYCPASYRGLRRRGTPLGSGGRDNMIGSCGEPPGLRLRSRWSRPWPRPPPPSARSTTKPRARCASRCRRARSTPTRLPRSRPR